MPHTAVIGLLAVCFVLAGFDAAAQCTIETPPSVAGGVSANAQEGLGQSFTPCETGLVTRISFSVLGPSSGRVRLGLQAGINLAAPSHSQGVDLVSGANTITLDAPFRVTAGTLYSFGLLPAAGTLEMRCHEENAYADGTLLQSDESTSWPRPGDLQFMVEIAPGASSTWGAVKERYR